MEHALPIRLLETESSKPCAAGTAAHHLHRMLTIRGSQLPADTREQLKLVAEALKAAAETNVVVKKSVSQHRKEDKEERRRLKEQKRLNKLAKERVRESLSLNSDLGATPVKVKKPTGDGELQSHRKADKNSVSRPGVVVKRDEIDAAEVEVWEQNGKMEDSSAKRKRRKEECSLHVNVGKVDIAGEDRVEVEDISGEKKKKLKKDR